MKIPTNEWDFARVFIPTQKEIENATNDDKMRNILLNQLNYNLYKISVQLKRISDIEENRNIKLG